MLDREVIKKFLGEEILDLNITLPQDISIEQLTNAFCLYVENDYFEWLRENSKSFFATNANGIDWNSVKELIKVIN
jgi:hypothetical protein